MKNKIHVILLAAGNSRRFGSNKLLTEFMGKPLYKHTLDKIVEINKWLYKEEIDCDVIVVSQYEKILEQAKNIGFIAVINSKPELGISYSIKLGINACDAFAGNYMFFVCDQPMLSLKSIKMLITSYIKSNKTIGCLSYKNVLGNPCIFDRKYVADFMKLEGDRGGKKIILLNQDSTLIVESVDGKELIDIDNMDDFNELENDLK